jgi:hypothetical protein
MEMGRKMVEKWVWIKKNTTFLYLYIDSTPRDRVLYRTWSYFFDSISLEGHFRNLRLENIMIEYAPFVNLVKLWHSINIIGKKRNHYCRRAASRCQKLWHWKRRHRLAGRGDKRGGSMAVRTWSRFVASGTLGMPWAWEFSDSMSEEPRRSRHITLPLRIFQNFSTGSWRLFVGSLSKVSLFTFLCTCSWLRACQ